MKTIHLRIPDSLDETEVVWQLAVFLFDKGMLTSGQAATMIGVSKREFIENVGKYGVSIFGESPEDIEQILLKRI